MLPGDDPNEFGREDHEKALSREVREHLGRKLLETIDARVFAINIVAHLSPRHSLAHLG